MLARLQNTSTTKPGGRWTRPLRPSRHVEAAFASSLNTPLPLVAGLVSSPEDVLKQFDVHADDDDDVVSRF